MLNFRKITSKAYEYLRLTQKDSMLQTKQVKNLSLLNLDGLKLDYDKLNAVRYSKEEIKNAYSDYMKAPYVNYFLRKSSVLSANANKQVGCLMQAINDSTPIKGTFYRGLGQCKNEETVRKYIFDNRGFTSVAPAQSKRVAETFFSENSGALIEFNLKTPIKGFQASSWETIFAPNTFTSSKFDLIKVEDKYYKIVEK